MRDTHFALELTLLGLSFLENAKLKVNHSGRIEDTPFRSLLLYNIREVQPGLWLPINRDYNVLGLVKDQRSDYSNKSYAHMLIKTEDINFDALWDNGDGKSFYTFSDSTHPGIYYRKSAGIVNRYHRYKKVIETAFFGKNTITFDDAWTYKENPDRKQLSYNKKRIRNRYEILLDSHVKQALYEIGGIEPWYDKEVDCWVFSHPFYPSVECGEKTPEEAEMVYVDYIREFIMHRLANKIDKQTEKKTIGTAGYMDDESFTKAFNSSRTQFFQIMGNL